MSEFKVFPALYFPAFGLNIKIHEQYHQKIINSNSTIKPLENCVKYVKSYQQRYHKDDIDILVYLVLALSIFHTYFLLNFSMYLLSGKAPDRFTLNL